MWTVCGFITKTKNNQYEFLKLNDLSEEEHVGSHNKSRFVIQTLKLIPVFEKNVKRFWKVTLQIKIFP